MNQKAEKIRVWPEMVLWESFSTIIASILLLLAAMYVDAPLESIADPSTSTNPSKAPWYFLGLQELLVYFSPWIAGVFIPTSIVLGLAAIPYIDIKDSGIGDEHSFVLEKLVKAVFTGGLALWIILTITGVYLRGPNWRLQLPNGAPLGTNTLTMPIDWTGPVIMAVYVAIIFCRLKTFKENIGEVGAPRCLLAHAMLLGGLIVAIKITLYTVLSF